MTSNIAESEANHPEYIPQHPELSNAEHRKAVLEAPVVLRVRDLEKSFRGLHAVDKVSFDLHEGEIISIIGPNGSGKSTTINLISGFIAPDSGIIDIDGNPVAGLSAAEVSDRGLARTFQNGRVFAGLSVDENIGLGYHKKLRAQRPFSSLQRFPLLRWLPLLSETGVALVPGPPRAGNVERWMSGLAVRSTVSVNDSNRVAMIWHTPCPMRTVAEPK